jgi:hypothetical protein
MGVVHQRWLKLKSSRYRRRKPCGAIGRRPRPRISLVRSPHRNHTTQKSSFPALDVEIKLFSPPHAFALPLGPAYESPHSETERGSGYQGLYSGPGTNVVLPSVISCNFLLVLPFHSSGRSCTSLYRLNGSGRGLAVKTRVRPARE